MDENPTSLSENQLTDARPYWHGGAPGLSPGELILPASKLPELPIVYGLLGPTNYPCDPNRVYVTVDRNFALAYAHNFKARINPSTGLPHLGSLYQVRPIGKVEEDPDCPPGTGNYQVESAVVISVEEERVELSDWDVDRFTLPYITWKDGTPCYDEDGYMLPSPEHRLAGITAVDLRRRGRWIIG